MMRMSMRIMKSQIQVPLLLIKTSSGTFDRTPYSMAGFRNYEAFLIGASGGRGGTAKITNSYRYDNTVIYPSGPGGGGTLRLGGLLASLPIKTSYAVGKQGADGADAIKDSIDTTLHDAQAGDGKVGGNTSFNGKTAYGGKGSTGGRLYLDNNLMRKSDPSNGGNGGSNSEGLGAIGQGGDTTKFNEQVSGPSDDPFTNISSTQATSGTFVAGTGDVLNGGAGGGGGAGKVSNGSYIYNNPRDGGSGNTGGAGGSGGSGGASFGGAGGGANAVLTAGTDVKYGSEVTGEGYNPDGVVVIKIS